MRPYHTLVRCAARFGFPQDLAHHLAGDGKFGRVRLQHEAAAVTGEFDVLAVGGNEGHALRAVFFGTARFRA